MAVKMKVGTEDKRKVYLLVGLLSVGVIVILMNSSEAPLEEIAATPVRSGPVTNPRPMAPIARAVVKRNDRTLREFRPTLKPKKPEDRPDPTAIDPTLQMELLSKVQTVTVAGAHRNIFEFGQAPPPKVEMAKGPKPKVLSPLIGPQPAPTAAQAIVPPPPPPQAPPVPLRFYGYVSGSNQAGKRAFFVEGEEIHVVVEGDIVKRRYKIVRIGVNSVIVEDTQFKSQQTLPLEEQPG